MQTSSPTPAPAAPPPPPALPILIQVPGGGVLVGGNDIGSLQAQLGDLRVTLSALRAEWRGLQEQLSSMRIDNPARPPVQQQAADVGVKIASTQGDIARIEAQLAQKGVYTGTPQPGPPPAHRQFDPDLAAGLMFAFIFAVLMPISIAMARRLWKGRPVILPAPDQTVAPRLDRLEQSIDAIAIEIERVSEGQRFVTRILAERPANHGSQASPANLNDVRAVGAGPAEPIPLAERQKVSQRNTPH
ncbi:MAG TPA: hypothetical protein VH277_04405 [Gemmatimonadaceae bacterium]|jgi:hypothetical protein|nr:hypothetical protein [Gemmatimonadaceae bacterium]